MILRTNIALLLGTSLIAAGQLVPRIKPPKKEKVPETQTLPLPPEPPAAVVAETGKLAFHVSPLSAKGLLTQQVHDALKALDRVNNGGTFVKLRAFVAGTGDMRRVAAIVSEEFSDRKIPLPAITTVQAGALPMEGAQVVIEAVSVEKKTVNPNGLLLVSGPLAQLTNAAKAQDAVMLQVTCYVGDLNNADAVRAAVAAAFPGAAANFIQLTRLAVEPETACEGIGRPAKPGKTPVEFGDTFVRVNTPKLVFTGIQMAFQDRDEDLRLAYGRMGKVLESVHASYAQSVALNVYALNSAVGGKMAALSREFLGASGHPAGTTRIVEGLPSLDASVGFELVAAGP